MKQKEIIEKLKEGGHIKGGYIGYSPSRLLLFEKDAQTWKDWLTPTSFEALEKKVKLKKEITHTSTINGIGGRMMSCATFIFTIESPVHKN